MNNRTASISTFRVSRDPLGSGHTLPGTLVRMLLFMGGPLLAVSACTSQPTVAESFQSQATPCKPSQLAFHLDAGNGRFDGMSHAGTMLVLRNQGATACTLPAQPRPGFTDANRQALQLAARARPDKQPATALPPILMAPGSSVHSDMRWVSSNVYDAGHCESPAFMTLAINKETIATTFAGQLCGAGGKPSVYTVTPFQPTATPTSTAATKTLTYACDDGRTVLATYPDGHTAILTIERQTYRLQLAVAADGARYTGGQWQWWSKGMHDARLTQLKSGEHIASGRGVACHAP